MRKIFITVLIIFLSVVELYSEEEESILVLNSYHPGFSWTWDIVKGIRSELGNKYNEKNLFIEFMDTRRHYDENEYYKSLLKIYKTKYSSKKLDVIITSDDNALIFVEKHRKDLFGDTPVVFCGVNFLSEIEFENPKLYTGIVEGMTIKENVNLILKILPKTKKIVMLSDQTTFGKMAVSNAQEFIKNSEHNVEYEIWDDYSIRTLYRELSNLPQDTAVFILAIHKDNTGRSYYYDGDLPELCENSSVPVWGMWKALLGNGIAGGKLNDGYAHGQKVAKLALEVIKNGKIKRNQIYPTDFYYMFDYSVLERFRISDWELPENSRIINKPFSFFETYTELVLGVIVSTFLLIITIIVMTIYIRYRKKTEQELWEASSSLKKLNDTLEDKVKERTDQLKKSLEDLRNTQQYVVEQEKMISLARTVSGMAHEINTPVGNCITASTMLGKSTGKISNLFKSNTLKQVDLKKYLENADSSVALIENNLNKVISLVESLKKLSVKDKIDFISHVDIAEYTEEILSILRLEHKNNPAELRLEVKRNSVLNLYSAAYFQIIKSIVANAYDFAFPEKSSNNEIKVIIDSNSEILTIDIVDNGQGIPKEEIKNIFEPFVTKHRDSGHAGLGLNIAYNLVTQTFKGKITADSDPGRGTDIHIEIPLS